MLRLYAPRSYYYPSQLERELGQLSALSDALFSPQNWGRDIRSRETDSLCSPVKQQEDGSYKMEVYLDLHKFKPTDISISTKDGRVTVAAKSEHREADGSFQSSSSFVRQFPIPEGVNKEQITAKFTEEGGVLLEAPCQPPKKEENKAVKGDQPLSIDHQ